MTAEQGNVEHLNIAPPKQPAIWLNHKQIRGMNYRMKGDTLWRSVLEETSRVGAHGAVIQMEDGNHVEHPEEILIRYVVELVGSDPNVPPLIRDKLARVIKRSEVSELVVDYNYREPIQP